MKILIGDLKIFSLIIKYKYNHTKMGNWLFKNENDKEGEGQSHPSFGLENQKRKYEGILLEKNVEMYEMKKRLEQLDEWNNKLNQEISNLKKQKLESQIQNTLGTSNADNAVNFNISRTVISQFVEDLLNDPEINTKIPDFLERKIYTNVLNSLLHVIDKVLESSSIQFMGHQITLDITPTYSTTNQ